MGVVRRPGSGYGRRRGRIARRRREPSADRQRADRTAPPDRYRRGARASACVRPRDPHAGDLVHGVLRRSEHRSGVAVRHHSPPDRRRRMDASSSAGLAQRLRALNHFIDDIYNDRRIIADGVFPADLLDDSVNYRPECEGVHPKFGVWAHISGSDLVRAGDGQLYVLEDNLRVPSGVSYVLENRSVDQASVSRAVPAPPDPTRRRVHRRTQQAPELARP